VQHFAHVGQRNPQAIQIGHDIELDGQIATCDALGVAGLFSLGTDQPVDAVYHLADFVVPLLFELDGEVAKA
jgi:hypothetical protein